MIARFHLDALTAAETEHYIAHRLAIGGRHGALPFDRPALQLIHRLSHGVPRRINLLCGRALLGAYATGQTVAGRDIVAKAATEVFGDAPAPPARPSRGLAAGLGVLAGAALLVGLGWATGVKLPWPSAAPGVAARVPVGASGLASAAGASAPPILPATSAAQPGATDIAPLLAALPRSEDAAWRSLLPAWKLPPESIGDADPCAALPAQGLQCFRGTRTSLALIRQLDRPALLTLTDAQGRSAYALLTGLTAQEAVVSINGGSQRVPLATLALWWRGDYATLWRQPPLAAAAKTDKARSAATAQWVEGRLASLPGAALAASGAPADNSLRSRIYRFQLAQGLTPDGQAGPITLMLLNHATGVDEPHLQN